MAIACRPLQLQCIQTVRRVSTDRIFVIIFLRRKSAADIDLATDKGQDLNDALAGIEMAGNRSPAEYARRAGHEGPSPDAPGPCMTRTNLSFIPL